MSPPSSARPADRAVAELPIGGRALVASDLFLSDEVTPSSQAAVTSIASELRAIEGAGVLVLAGNCFELTPRPRPAVGSAPGAPATVSSALAAHPELCAAFRDFLARDGGGGCRRVIFLPGVRDRAICYEEEAAAPLLAIGCEIALAADISVTTSAGPKVVRVEPGWRHDERSAFADPTDPHDTPLGHHALTDLFPALKSSRSGWLDGIDRLQDPAGLPRFIASRLMYRRLGRYAWWLLIPVAIVILGRLPGYWVFGAPDHLRSVNRLLVDVLVTVVLELVAAAVLLAVVNRRLWAGAGNALLGPPGDRVNDGAREAAREFVAEGGGGLVTGHSLRAEIGDVGRGFFANTGACSTVVEERGAAFGLPPVFVASEQVSFVTIEGGADVHARLTLSSEQQAAGSVIERLVAGPRRAPVPQSVVGSYPGHSWPPIEDPVRRRRLVRRLVAALVAAIGVLDVVTALLPPNVRGHLHPYLGYVPLGVSAAAGALVGLAGMALLFVARGLRRGHRLAWLVAVSVLALTSVLHIVREGQVLPTVASLAVLGALVWARESFQARYEPAALRTALWTLAGGAVAVPVLVTIILEFGIQFDRDHGPLPWPTAFAAAVERLVGIDSIALPHVAAVFLNPAELVIGVGLALVALAVGFRPVAERRREGSHGRALRGAATGEHADGIMGLASGTPAASDFGRAREVVQRRASGTLDYFALRSDKQHFFARDGVVAYAVHNGVALVSPDPICPAEERASLWAAFRQFADEHAWSVAILGAGQEWLPVYHGSGMRDLYIGDEAVVDVRTLSLEGGTKKGLRQAVNRIAKYGYTISFHDPADVDEALAASLRDVMVKSRRGGVERGFSMTLGRIFDPTDSGLLLAVAHGPGDGAPVAFCQFVPAPGIRGYSLDLMRRDPGEHPNGLLDFILVRTMAHLKEEGCEGLGLNFAMMRAVLAGEAGGGLTTKVERFVLRRMSDSMQIESLWRFNAKFDPRWLPRYVVWDAAEHSLGAALAIARAESFWELPLIGRFLVPSAPAAAAGAASS